MHQGARAITGRWVFVRSQAAVHLDSSISSGHQGRSGHVLQPVGVECDVVTGDQLTHLGLTQGRLGVEQVAHLVEALLEAALADAKSLLGGRQRFAAR